MSENKKVLFIINKFSGTGYRPEVDGRIISRCNELSIECTLEYTQSRGHASELAREGVSSQMDAVFAVGGDGTVNEVAQGLVDTPVAMGILPKGSGNGLARHLGIPMNFKRSLCMINSQKSIQMDTFLINNKLSVNVSGIGFDGHIASMFGKDGKRGLIGYVKLVMKEFLSFEEAELKGRVDQRELESKIFMVSLANSSQFGNNARVAPQASVVDQNIDICLIKKVPFIQLLGFAQKMFTGQFNKSAFVEIIKATNATLQFEKPMAYHIDGEAVEPEKEFRVQIKPASLKILIPETEWPFQKKVI